MTQAGERLMAAAKEMRGMTKIPEDIIKAARRCYDGLGRGSVSDSEHIARAIMAERERCAKDIQNLLEMVRVRNAALEDWENGRVG